MIKLSMRRSCIDAKYEFFVYFDTTDRQVMHREIAEFMSEYPQQMIEYNPNVIGHKVPNWEFNPSDWEWLATGKLIVNDDDIALFLKLSCN